MEITTIIAIITFVAGFLVGLGLAFWLKSRQIREAEQLREKDLASTAAFLEQRFENLANQALSDVSSEFIKYRQTEMENDKQAVSSTLNSKKELIDQRLEAMNQELGKVQRLMSSLENAGTEKFGELKSRLESQNQQVELLMQTTNSLREALSSTKARGQWGERMAEDVLRLAGFVEGINYRKQEAIEGIGTRPDFTFALPQGQVLNMDVKFPLDNYLRYLEVDAEEAKSQYSSAFLRDIKEHIKAVSKREYINPQQNTLNYALMFIPNDQVYTFIHEQDSSLLDKALESHVVLCSPLTLYAILSVIRQAADNFAMETTSHKMMELYRGFNDQWQRFCGELEKLGRQLDGAQSAFEKVSGVRKNKLEKALDKIDELRNSETGLISDDDSTQARLLPDDD